MDKIKSKPGLLHFFEDRTPEIRWYFEHMPQLVADFPLDVALAYVFSQVESAHVMALYCGIVKLHDVDGDLTRRAVNIHHLSRKDFRQKYETVYTQPIPDTALTLLTYAEGVRDRVMHGKNTTDDDKRNAIAHVLMYAEEFNGATVARGGPKPFGDLRGFKGRSKSLDASTSRWVLKGMGFSV